LAQVLLPVLLSALLCDAAPPPTRALQVGVLATRSPSWTLSQWQPTFDALAQRLPGVTFEVQAWNYDELERQVHARKLDLLLTNPEHFILERQHGLTPIATVMPMVGGHPETHYSGVIFVRADSTVRTLADVAQAPTAAVSEKAIAGFLMQRWELVKQGLDVNPDVQFLGAAEDEVVASVLASPGRVGFVRSGVLEELAAEGVLDLGRIRVIAERIEPGFRPLHSTELVPEWPVLTTARVAGPLARELARALLELTPDSDAARAGGYFGFAPAADYSPVEALLKRLDMRPRTQEFDLRDVFEKYSTSLALGLVVLLAVALAVVFRLARDTRRLERAAEALGRSNDHAQAASQAKSRFLATMSHEIRSPLNGVLGMAQLLVTPTLGDAERLEYARTIVESGTSLLTILNDVLDLAKVEAGRLELVSAPLLPSALMADVRKLFGHVARLKGLDLEVTLAADADTWLRGDAVRLRQMMANLVGNAVKFTEAGRVAVRVSVSTGSVLRCEVSDTGPGIPAGQVGQLFKPFSQLEGKHASRPSGTGLGLSIVRELAQAMGGETGVTSAPGQGSTFWFTAALERCPPRERALAPAGPPRPERIARRVLVVEDNSINRKVVEGMLRRLGCTWTSVVNGKEALGALATQGPFDVVLMDCQMPEMDGFEATRQLRAREALEGGGHQLVVALTAAAFEEDRRRCVEVGMDGFLAKPVSLDMLAVQLAAAPSRAPAPPPG
jgi:signal transduction histidine kinase/ActR/RegA family two-component response regulator